MNRRELITLLGGAAVAWPLAARAQQRERMRHIGVLMPYTATDPQMQIRNAAFLQGLQQLGWTVGQNVQIDYRWSAGNIDDTRKYAVELVALSPDVIFAPGTAALGPLLQATRSIPIVFTTGADPVAAGLIRSLSRPGGNITGVTTLNLEVAPKRLELLHELLPRATAMALVVNPTNPPIAEPTTRDLQGAARTLGLQLHVLHASSERDFEEAFASVIQLRASALVIGADQFFNSRIEQLGALSMRYAVPTIYQYRDFVAAGGLMSYGSRLTDAYRLAGTYTGRILKGEKPADLPVLQATKVELIINLKSAKALGLTFPIALLGRADEVIE
jgi:putative tryptophan/tyrosine transport system substrate-binding protein